MKPKTQDLDEFSQKIMMGVRKAVHKMIEERAEVGEVVMVGDGEEGFKYVLAEELLELIRKSDEDSDK